MKYYLFIDESGDHNLSKIDPTYPMFALGGLCISELAYEELNNEIDTIKEKYYGSVDIILHSSELKRPKDSRSDSRNMFLLDPEQRKVFYQEIDTTIVMAHEFSLAACFIHKQLHIDYYSQPADPYYFSFENLINRVLWYTKDATVEIVAECRGKELDNALLAEYERLKSTGARFHSGEDIERKTKLVCKPKSENINGLQIIDLALSSLTRHYLGKTEKMIGNDLSPFLLEEKYMFQSPTFFPRKK